MFPGVWQVGGSLHSGQVSPALHASGLLVAVNCMGSNCGLLCIRNEPPQAGKALHRPEVEAGLMLVIAIAFDYIKMQLKRKCIQN